MSRGEAARPDGDDLFRPSLALFVGLCLVAVSFRNLGWDTRAMTGRLQPAIGHVLTSVDDGEICAKGGGCRPMYRTTVAYDGDDGRQVFSIRWAARYRPGEPVNVQHAIGRPGMARIALTADFSGGLGTVLTVLCGLGYPVFVGALVMLLRGLIRGGRPDRRVTVVWLTGLAVASPLFWFVYWY